VNPSSKQLFKTLSLLHVLTLFGIVSWAMFQRSGFPVEPDWFVTRAGKIMVLSAILLTFFAVLGFRTFFALFRSKSQSIAIFLLYGFTWICIFSSIELCFRIIVKETPWKQRSLLGYLLLPRDWSAWVAHHNQMELKLRGETFLEYAPGLGWAPGKMKQSADGLYFSGKDGFRVAGRSYEETSQDKVISLFGDSFIFGNGVLYHETIGGHLQKLVGQNASVQNWGVSAYGTDQALIRYLEQGRKFKPSWVVLGVFPDDLLRNVTCYPSIRRPEWEFFSKPRFVTHPKFQVINTPVPQLEDYQTQDTLERLPCLAFDRFYQIREWQARFWHRSLVLCWLHARFPRRGGAWERDMLKESIEVTNGILKSFYDVTLKDGGRPLILYLPDITYSPEPDRRTRKVLLESGLPFIDPAKEIQKIPATEQIGPDGSHYSSRVNEVIARAVYEAILSSEGKLSESR
jgi:hypothetical protein